MKRLAFLLICLACVAAGFALKSGLDDKQVTDAIRAYGPWVAVVMLSGLLIVSVGVWTGYAYVRRLARKTLQGDINMTETEMVTGLVDHFTTPEDVANPTSEQRKRAGLINVGLWLARRQAIQFTFNATVAVVGGLVGTATLFLLYEQNRKIDLQNDRITLQTDANIAQSILLEGSRRAALSGDLANLLQDIRAERALILTRCPSAPIERCFRVDPGSNGEVTYHLSRDLRNRVISFAASATPYRLAISKTDTLDFDKPLSAQYDFPSFSPERGQLLTTLVQNNISLRGLDLSHAYAPYADLSGANLHSVNLSHADLSFVVARRAMFHDVVLDQSSLIYGDFTRAEFVKVRAESINMQNGQFAFAKLVDTRMVGARLVSADFTNASIKSSTLQAANLASANLSDTHLMNSVFGNARLRQANFRNAVASSNVFANADLGEAFLLAIRGKENWIHQAKFFGTDLSADILPVFRVARGYPPEGVAPGTMIEHCDLELSAAPPGISGNNCAMEPVTGPPLSGDVDDEQPAEMTEF